MWLVRLLQVLPYLNWRKWGSFRTSRVTHNQLNLLHLLPLLTLIRPHLDFLQVSSSFQVAIRCPLNWGRPILRYLTRTQKSLMHSYLLFWVLWTRRVHQAATATSLVLLRLIRTSVALLAHKTPCKIILVLSTTIIKASALLTGIMSCLAAWIKV